MYSTGTSNVKGIKGYGVTNMVCGQHNNNNININNNNNKRKKSN